MRDIDEARRAARKSAADVECAREKAWRVFFEASGRLQGMLESRLKRSWGLSLVDYNVLLALWETPDHRLRMSDLASRVVYSPSRLTYIAEHLERDGWLRRVVSPNDRRSLIACLTSQGIATIESAAEVHRQIIREYLLKGVDDEEIGEIVRIFSAMGDRLRSEDSKGR